MALSFTPNSDPRRKIRWNTEAVVRLNEILSRDPRPPAPAVAAEMGVTESSLQAAITRFGLTRQGRAQNVIYSKAQKPLQPAAKRVRNCMCCERPFGSQGIHNRLCNECGGVGHNEEA